MRAKDQFTVRTAAVVAAVEVIQEWIAERRRVARVGDDRAVSMAEAIRWAIMFAAEAIRGGLTDAKEAAALAMKKEAGR